MGSLLTALIERLGELADNEGCWSIPPEEVARLLGIEQVRFWRAVHEVRDRISFADAIDGWTQDTVGELVTVLEGLLGTGVEQELTRAGLFIPYSLGIELTEELLFRARRTGAAHDIRTEELGAMLRHTGSVRASIGIYLDTYTDTEALIDESAEFFQAVHGMPPRGATAAKRCLHTMFARHVLDRRNLLAGLEERLRISAALLGYVDPEDRARAEQAQGDGAGAGGGIGPGSARRAWALRVMDLDGRAYTAEDLRSSYRQLMMRHHPDVDPSGLERCKDVNVAYALLISDLSDPAR